MTTRPDFAFIVFDDIQSLDLTGPWEVTEKAADTAGVAVSMLTASLGGGPVTTSSGLRIEVDAAIEDVAAPDTLVVVGGHGVTTALADPRLLEEIARLAAGARRVASVCSGSFLLAEAGLLDGRRATTHWTVCEDLAERYPKVQVDPDAIYVRDGDVWTSAGVTSGIDLALGLAEDDYGREVALRVARQLVVYARRPGGQSQFSVQLESQTAEREPLRELQSWMAEHPDADLSVAVLASRLHVSERQLSRIFGAELGSSPGDYVERLRIERARSVLETDEAPLDAVASRCGFPSSEVMRRAFQRRLGTSPSGYRDRFRSPTAA